MAGEKKANQALCGEVRRGLLRKIKRTSKTAIDRR